MFGPYVITDNTFTNGQKGVWMDGIAHYDVIKNSIEVPQQGVVALSTGWPGNSIAQNSFVDNNSGIEYFYDNHNSSFTENCFGTIGFDVYNNGEISFNIGDYSTEAGNCFTTPSPDNIPEIINHGEIFNYYLANTFFIDACKRPRQNNFNIVFGDPNSVSNFCADGGRSPIDPTDPDNPSDPETPTEGAWPIFPERSESAIQTAIEELDNQEINILSSSLSDQMKSEVVNRIEHRRISKLLSLVDYYDTAP